LRAQPSSIISGVRSSCDQRHHAWSLFSRAHAALVETLDAELRQERELPLTWFDVLAHLAGAPQGRMRMNELGEAVLLTRSGVTRLVDRMTEAGLLVRCACPSDRRVVFAALTPKGRAALAEAGPVAVRGVEQHFARHLTAAEEKAFVSALSKLVTACRAPGSRR
jgi:DNA-binding MarR family transcriptional regulator